MDYLNEKTYVDQAQSVLKTLIEPYGDNKNLIKLKIVSTSKIRNILSMAADIYDLVLKCQTDKLSDELVSRIEYLRVRMIYECGREEKVKKFIMEANLIDYAKMIGDDKKRYILFYRYLEALVAFHRYYGGDKN